MLESIVEQIRKDPVHLSAVEAQVRHVPSGVEPNGNVLLSRLPAELAEHFLYHDAYVRAVAFEPNGAAVLKQLLHQVVEMVHLRHDDIEERLHRFAALKAAGERAERGGDAEQR